MNAKTILIHIYALESGGAERVFALLASGLARRGHAVTLAVDYEAGAHAAALDPAVRIVALGRSHARSLHNLARLLRDERPSVSLSAIGSSNLKHAVAAGLAGRLDRAILSYHGFFVSEPNLLSRLGNGLTPLTTRVCARAVFVSEALRADFIRRFRADPRRCVRIHNPVDLAAAEAPSAEELRARAPLVLAVGRLVPVKAFPALVRAFAEVERRDAQLVIVGEGPERPAIEAEVARLRLQGRVTLAGFVAEPWSWFRQSTCLASSSRSESFGNVLVEALAHGLGVVATDSGGPREIVTDPRHGMLVPVGDEAELAKGIDALLADPGDPEPRIARAQAFSLEAALDRYEALFEEVDAAARGDGRAVA